MKKLVICLSVYNGAEDLEKCMDSLLNQTYKEFYIFLFDNNSTDSTLKIADQYVRSMTFGGIPWPDLFVFHAISFLDEKENLERCLKVINEKVPNSKIEFIEVTDILAPDYVQGVIEGMKE